METNIMNSKKQLTSSEVQKILLNNLNQVTKLLIEEDVDLNYIDPDTGDAPLHSAIQDDRRDYLVSILLNNGGNINLLDTMGNSTLHRATTKSATCVKQLLDHGANFFHKNIFGKTALNITMQEWLQDVVGTLSDWYLYKSLNSSVIRILLEYGSQLPGEAKEIEMYRNYCTLCKSIFLNDIISCGNVLQKISTHEIDFHYINEFSPLIFAALLNRAQMVGVLVKRGASLQPPLFLHNITFFEALVKRRQREIVEILLHYGFNINDNCKLVLFRAIDACDFDLVSILTDTKYNLDLEAQDEFGRTVIHSAVNKFISSSCNKEYLMIVNFLISLGVNLRHKDHFGNTVLHYNLHCYNEDSCKLFFKILLLTGDSNVDANFTGKFPEHVSSSMGCHLLSYFRKMVFLDPNFEKLKVFTNLVVGIYHNINWNDVKNIDTEDFQKEIASLTTYHLTREKALSDLLLLKENLAVKYCNDRKLNEIYMKNNENFENEFIHFGFLLNFQYRRGVTRRLLMESARRVIQDVTNCFITFTYFPEECIDMILDFFNDAELIKMTERKFLINYF